ncbi:MAG: enoyl-CoA hydratase [Myxococcaceae bacterium]
MSEWKVDRDGDVAVISLDDGKANALLVPEFEGLEGALAAVEHSSALAVVLTGRPGYFSAGLNLKALPTLSLEEKQKLVAAMGSAVTKLFLFPKPVVAAVSGHALGGGAMFALAADLRVFADGPYKFGLNEVQLGLFVPSYAVELARACISPSRLTEFVGHGRVLTPLEALSMHIAESVHAPEAVLAAALIRARGLAALSGTGYALTKRLVRGAGVEAAQKSLPGELAELARMLDSRT